MRIPSFDQGTSPIIHKELKQDLDKSRNREKPKKVKTVGPR